MAAPRRQKSKDNDLDYKQEKDQQNIEASEVDQQQDLNQGMQTGTHDTTRHGVDWGSSYEGPQGRELQEDDEDEDNSNSSPRKQKGTKPSEA